MAVETLYKLHERKTLLTDFYVFDVETVIRKNGRIKYYLEGQPENFAFGVIYGFNYQKVIHSVSDFKKELLHPRYKNKKMFAHNAQYDLGAIYSNIFELDPECLYNGSRFICASNGNCQFADSLNIFQCKVETLGEMMGKPKKQLQYRWKKSVTKKDIEYCIRDCEIVYDALAEIFNEVGSIKITQASLSLAYYRRHYQPFHIRKNHHVDNFWTSYYGGRTEAFQMGKTHASVIDINSMYPYVMQYTKFPNPITLKKLENVSRKYLIRLLKNFEGCAKIEVEHKDHFFGFLPLKKDGKLIFPVGKFTGCWNFNEIRFALKHKVIKIKHIHWVCYGQPMESIFKSFVNDLYARRLVSDNEFESFRIKTFLSSLYGKFAQRIQNEEVYIADIDKDYDRVLAAKKNGTFIKLRMFNAERLDGFLIKKSEKVRSFKHSIPSFSSYITSQARVMLLEKMLEFQKYNIVYCDTDSIFFEIMPENLNESSVLGGWKLENKIVTEIKGLKNYRYKTFDEISKKWNEKRKLKGVPKNAIEIEKNIFTFTNLVKAKEALVRAKKMNTQIERSKNITNNYTKRQVFENYTKPIKL